MLEQVRQLCEGNALHLSDEATELYALEETDTRTLSDFRPDKRIEYELDFV